MSAYHQSRLCKLLIATLLIICSTTTPDHLSQGPQGGKSKQDGVERKMGETVMMQGATNNYRGLNTLGSSPPSCEHKCGECNPCKAIQVPTNTDRVATHYANYEPEGWKCKCGSSFFNP